MDELATQQGMRLAINDTKGELDREEAEKRKELEEKLKKMESAYLLLFSPSS